VTVACDRPGFAIPIGQVPSPSYLLQLVTFPLAQLCRLMATSSESQTWSTFRYLPQVGEVTRPVSGGGPLIRTCLPDRVGSLQLAVSALQLAPTLQHRGVSDSDDNRAGGHAEAIQTL
jgi:hypothetical protein